MEAATRWRRGAGFALVALLAIASLEPSAQRARLGLAPQPLQSAPPPPLLLDGPAPRNFSVGPDATTSAPRQARAEVRRRAAELTRAKPRPSEPLEPLADAEREPTPATPEGGTPSPDADDEPRLAVPSLDAPLWMTVGAMPEAGPRPAAPTTTTRRATDPDVAGKLLARSLRQRDKINGIDLSAGATVASMLADGARLHLPGVSRGLFVASIGADGKLAGIQVVTFSDGSLEQWQRAAHHAEDQLAGRTFALAGPFARGAAITVRVTSNLQLPSGAGRSRRHDPLAAEPVPLALESQKPRWPFAPRYGARTPLRLRGRDYPLETDIALPRLQMSDTPEDGGIPLGGLTFGGSGGALLSGSFDVSDIGAHPQRVVDTSFSCEPLPGEDSGS